MGDFYGNLKWPKGELEETVFVFGIKWREKPVDVPLNHESSLAGGWAWHQPAKVVYLLHLLQYLKQQLYTSQIETKGKASARHQSRLNLLSNTSPVIQNPCPNDKETSVLALRYGTQVSAKWLFGVVKAMALFFASRGAMVE